MRGKLPEKPDVSPSHLFNLEGQTAVVTGAAGGIGRVLCRTLGSAGADLALIDVNGPGLADLAAELRECEITALPYQCDLAKVKDIRRVIGDIAANQGMNILVNSAGMNIRMPTMDVDEETYDKIMATNLKAPFFTSQAAAREMKKNGGGSIIHVGSINAVQGLPEVGVYGPAKAGLGQLTKVQAIEWQEYNILVNCIAPGFMDTSLTKPLQADPVRSKWISKRVPQGRFGDPEELSGAVLLCASRAASYMTGQTIYVDGGFIAGSDWRK